MPPTEGAFLVLLFAGVAALIAGLLWTRLNWRPDVPPYSRSTRTLDVQLHPERYATHDALRTIRLANIVGALCTSGAVLVLAYELLRIMLANSVHFSG